MASLISATMANLHLLVDTFISMLILPIARLLHVPPKDLAGKVAIVTGANSGIGYSLALSLASRNATVYLACRSTDKAHAAASQIIDATKSKRVHVLSLDTSSLASVRAFAATWADHPIDLLFHNAGISNPPAGQDITDEDLGTIYATNFAGSFLLTSLLEPHFTPSARVIFTSSTGQYAATPQRLFDLPRLAPQPSINGKKPITDSAFYSDTKFMQVASARLLQDRFNKQSSQSPSGGSRKTAHSFTPGYTFTPIFSKFAHLPWYADPLFWVLKVGTALCVPVDQGAATGLWLATTDDEQVVGAGKGGEYWDRCVRRRTAVETIGDQMLERMWQVWERDSGAEWA